MHVSHTEGEQMAQQAMSDYMEEIRHLVVSASNVHREMNPIESHDDIETVHKCRCDDHDKRNNKCNP